MRQGEMAFPGYPVPNGTNVDLKEKTVLTNLRSVAQSMKGGVPVDRLQEDYRSILGVGIPFRELGYRSLDGFLRDIPEVIRLEKGSDGRLMALGVADSSTAHIVSLVSRQKAGDARRGKRGRKAPLHYAARVPRYPTRGSGYSPTYAAQKFNKTSSFPTSKQFLSRRSPPRRSSPPQRNPPPQRSPPPQSIPPPRRSPSPPQRSPLPPRRPIYKKPETVAVQSDNAFPNATSTSKGPSSYRRSSKTEIAPPFSTSD
ncbi:tudor domain-containing protein 7-like [Uloborus diversus]|uniref:tudor domain-containing protein 7-like n=1 Tax=Uloborus diversus TaxID=327109 RepID=UPI002409E91D|nr:tudor domain-containing protein 7-like [Uloborus diversus]